MSLGLNIGLIKAKPYEIQWVRQGYCNEHPMWHFECMGHRGEVVNNAGDNLWAAKLDNQGKLGYASEAEAKKAVEEHFADFVNDMLDMAIGALSKYGAVIDCEHTHDVPVATVKLSKLADFMKEEPTLEWVNDDFPVGTKFYTSPQPLIELQLREALITACNVLTTSGTGDSDRAALKVIQNHLENPTAYVLRDPISEYMSNPIAYAICRLNDVGNKVIHDIRVWNDAWANDTGELGERWAGNKALTIDQIWKVLPERVEAYQHFTEANKTQFYLQQEHMLSLIKQSAGVIDEYKAMMKQGGTSFALVTELLESVNFTKVFVDSGAQPLALGREPNPEEQKYLVTENALSIFIDQILTLCMMHGMGRSWMGIINRATRYIESGLQFTPEHMRQNIIAELERLLSCRGIHVSEPDYKRAVWENMEVAINQAKIEENPFEFLCKQIEVGLNTESSSVAA
ncbi:MAG: hypothetical protein ACTS9Y_00360 [Methylophilus sp.]|uniref:hypothetical protein n=1 Tax=Methylophilus sp. TaxID=29541 RepID=UPI003FA0C7AC